MRLRHGFLIPDFILDALDGRALVVYGGEELTQTLCYVTDMVDGLVRLMQSGPDVSLVNLGAETQLRMVDVAQMIIEMTRSSSEIKYEEGLLFLTKKGAPSIARAKDQLGWLSLVRLPDGLRQTIDFTIANKSMLTLNHS